MDFLGLLSKASGWSFCILLFCFGCYCLVPQTFTSFLHFVKMPQRRKQYKSDGNIVPVVGAICFASSLFFAYRLSSDK